MGMQFNEDEVDEIIREVDVDGIAFGRKKRLYTKFGKLRIS